MAHLSGGGSYSGGSHYGGSYYVSFASRNVRGGTGGTGGTGGSAPGASGRISLAGRIALFLFFILITGLVGYATWDEGVFRPQPLERHFYSGITISDETGALETAELESAMQDFLDATGVSPAVKVITDTGDRRLAHCAYQSYHELFRDEEHWLVVLLLPEGDDTAWSWEGVIGDDCAPAISEYSERRFTKTVQRHLRRTDGGSIGQRLADAYAEFTETAMQPRPEPFPLVFGSLVTVLFILSALWPILVGSGVSDTDALRGGRGIEEQASAEMAERRPWFAVAWLTDILLQFAVLVWFAVRKAIGAYSGFAATGERNRVVTVAFMLLFGAFMLYCTVAVLKSIVLRIKRTRSSPDRTKPHPFGAQESAKEEEMPFITQKETDYPYSEWDRDGFTLPDELKLDEAITPGGGADRLL